MRLFVCVLVKKFLARQRKWILGWLLLGLKFHRPFQFIQEVYAVELATVHVRTWSEWGHVPSRGLFLPSLKASKWMALFSDISNSFELWPSALDRYAKGSQVSPLQSYWVHSSQKAQFLCIWHFWASGGWGLPEITSHIQITALQVHLELVHDVLNKETVW